MKINSTSKEKFEVRGDVCTYVFKSDTHGLCHGPDFPEGSVKGFDMEIVLTGACK